MSRADVLLQYTSGPKSGVFTDGSCEGNPGPGGWGAVWVEDDRIVDYQLRMPDQKRHAVAAFQSAGVPQPSCVS